MWLTRLAAEMPAVQQLPVSQTEESGPSNGPSGTSYKTLLSFLVYIQVEFYTHIQDYLSQMKGSQRCTF